VLVDRGEPKRGGVHAGVDAEPTDLEPGAVGADEGAPVRLAARSAGISEAATEAISYPPSVQEWAFHVMARRPAIV
jgi:hypothetical protein